MLEAAREAIRTRRIVAIDPRSGRFALVQEIPSGWFGFRCNLMKLSFPGG
jgi:hypothetical protein